jgi:hypothetical protein
MENINFFDDEDSELTPKKTKSKYLRVFFMKLLWTMLTLGGAVALLLFLTLFLGWSKFFLSCLIGLLTGISLAAGLLTSLQNRALITLLLGVLILPGLAVYVSLMAGSDPRTFEASSSALMPFVAYAPASLIASITIAKIWQNMPVRGKNKDEEKEPVPVLTPAKKEHTNHEGSALDKAA